MHIFSCDLEMLVGIAINPTSNTECLTRLGEGTLDWSKRTTNKIKSVSIEDKQMRLVVSMFSLFLNLMLDVDDNLSESSRFEEFMTEFSLRKLNK